MYGIQFNRNGFFTDYITKEQCNNIKGIFILLVFISHSLQYIDKAGYVNDNILDVIFTKCSSVMGQLIVVMFLFYSGFGIMESVKRSDFDGGGGGYIKSLPSRRLWPTLRNFDIAVICFIILNVLLGIKMEVNQVIFSFIGWDSVGNSNWYIFDILLCYSSTYITFSICKDRKKAVLLNTLLLVSLMAIIYFVKPFWWYDTILSYSAGMIYSFNKSRVERILQNRFFVVLSTSSMIIILLELTHVDYLGIVHNVESVVFALLVVTLTMKVKNNNKYLNWCGRNLFSMYIYQRIPMILLFTLVSKKSVIFTYPVLFILLSFVGTLLIVAIYNKVVFNKK